jgi:hypothetical protein
MGSYPIHHLRFKLDSPLNVDCVLQENGHGVAVPSWPELAGMVRRRSKELRASFKTFRVGRRGF